ASPFIAEEIIITWLRDIYDQNQRYAELLENSRRKQQRNGGVSRPQDFNDDDFDYLKLPLQFPKGSLVELLKRIKHIAKFLQSTEPGTLPTPSLLFREFYPLLADFYEDMRLHSDFKENISMDGVISYAYAYHHTINNLKERYPVVPQSFLGESFNLESENAARGKAANSTPGSIASKLTNILFKKNNAEGANPNGAFTESFWQGVEHVEAEESDGPSGNEEQIRKRKILRNEQKQMAANNKKAERNQKFGEISPLGSPVKIGADGRPIRMQSVRFGFDEVYEPHQEVAETKLNGKERGILKSKNSAYIDYGEVYTDETDQSGFDASKSTLVIQGTNKSASFEMGDVYEKPKSFFQAPESLFLIDNLPPPESNGNFRSPVVTYGDIYECQSQFSMSESTLLQTPGGVENER
ncbi:MAG: hypothetical protein K2Z81_17805, partial [Cyanobacteria bacterium]|nr:hypothetical protein [Cyanobacteriota bacterium]